MFSTGRRLSPVLCLAMSSVLFCPAFTYGQNAPKPTANAAQSDARADASTSADPAAVRELAQSIRDLREQIETLQGEVKALREQEQRDQDENAELQRQLTRSDTVSAVSASVPKPSAQPVAYSAPAQQAPPSLPPQRPADQQTLEQRLSTLEDQQDLTDSKLSDQYQTKLESGSRYRVRLSGIVLLNLFENRGTVDSIDFPEFAEQGEALGSSTTFGGSLRQSQLGLDVFGPDVAGAHTSASVKMDFAGGFANTPNGVAEGLVRLRTATMRLDWKNTSVVAGQDYLFFAPLAPTSIAMLAVPALSYSGNLWSWTPQVRVERRVSLTEGSSIQVSAGILDSFSGDLPYSSYVRYQSWGEESGQPAYAARTAWSHSMYGREMTIGVGGYFGRQMWGFGRIVDGWAGTTDVTVPLGKYFGFTGEFYRGRALGGLGGGIGQDIVLNGSMMDPTTTIEGLDSLGGWAQLKFKPVPKFEINAGFGMDNPFASELRRLNSTSGSYYGELLARNRTPLVNFIYQVRSNILFSTEFRRLNTFTLDSAATANLINLSVGYQF